MLSIIILNYNHKNLLKNCLKSLKEAGLKLDYEIIITDNNSNDGSQEFLSKFKVYPVKSCKAGSPMAKFNRVKSLKFKVILNSQNNGYAQANNQAIKLAKGKYVLILNPDVIVLPNSIEQLIKYLQKNKKAGMVGPQLLNPDKTVQNSCYNFPKLITPAVRRTFLGKLPGFKKELARYLMLDFDHQQIKEVDWLIGACLMIKKEVLEKVGYFDERYFLYFEDVDLAKKVWQAGYKVVYFPKVQMIHFHRRLSADRSALVSLFSKITWVHISSALKFFIKWRGGRK
ncbi:glycosyltransferase family 2 protein [Patescibacteria group bacterium]|nr:glycosyltransferase family 2 protein [Patescibacteria group bacterium]